MVTLRAADPRQQNIVFFPALIDARHRQATGGDDSYVAAGMAISLRHFSALVCCNAYTRDRFGNAAVPLWFWRRPRSRCSSARCTESLFLLAARAIILEQFGRAAWGLLVGLTRLSGALLVLPLGCWHSSAERPDG